MAKKAKIQLPTAALPDLIRWWESANVRGIIIGGLAVALLGRPRVTRDIDAMVILPEAQWQDFMMAARAFGFVPRCADALAFAREARVLLLRHEATAVDVDIAFGMLPFEEEAVSRARNVEVAEVSVPLPTAEDLIIMKAVAHRDRDLTDIDGLLAAHPNIDLGRMRRWVRTFADALEMPELYEDLERRLSQRAVRPRRKKKS